jgi:SPX domain protein involved in polyphosphate accumulation
MNERQTREFRYERKFVVDQLDAHQVRALVRLHPSMFYEPYPPRYVNNLYLDTHDMKNYFDNVHGAGERRKVRLRWYGGLFRDIQEPMLEFKIKSGLVGTKHIYPFAPFTLDNRFCHRYYQEILREADLSESVRLYMCGLNVVLCNRYYRWYFATRDQRFRVTIDTHMAYYQVRKVNNHFMHKYVDHNHVVVEMKYQKPLDVQAGRVAAFFPFSMTKNSKYVTGIEQVYL